ncbi:MAG: hypothetical protein HC763_29725 [Hydrococcus sp. CRU_1_1]|nr:hypothetical protein [Hydrococcus sp. CRU_1_1]
MEEVNKLSFTAKTQAKNKARVTLITVPQSQQLRQLYVLFYPSFRIFRNREKNYLIKDMPTATPKLVNNS